jgi:hypothetical protein
LAQYESYFEAALGATRHEHPDFEDLNRASAKARQVNFCQIFALAPVTSLPSHIKQVPRTPLKLEFLKRDNLTIFDA